MSAAARAELIQWQLTIATGSQFPSRQPPPASPPFQALGAGLGVIAFKGPQGAGFVKGGHKDSTVNMGVCMGAGKRCVVILSSDVRAEPAFPALVRSVLGQIGLPRAWEHGGMPFGYPACSFALG